MATLTLDDLRANVPQGRLRVWNQTFKPVVSGSASFSADIHIVLSVIVSPGCPFAFVNPPETVASQWGPPMPVNVVLWPDLFLLAWKTV